MSPGTGREFDLETVDRLLTTTRSVRKRLDLHKPVDLKVIRTCLEVAIQAPTGSNAQTWRWIVVTNAQKRRALAALYQNPPADLRQRLSAAPAPPVTDLPQQQRVMASTRFLV